MESKLHQLRSKFTSQLEGLYPAQEIESFFYILCDFFLKYSRIQVSLCAESVVSNAHLELFDASIKRLEKHEPIQYIIGETEFYGLPFNVNAATLIPRPETEELVAWVISDCNTKTSHFNILDIGTGSGCIAVAIAKHLPKANVFAIDISQKAIAIAAKNATFNNVKIDFQNKNILEATHLQNNYDVIISNPPYVREMEKAAMHFNVLNFEPNLALYVSDKDPLIFYRKIAELAIFSLNIGGWLYFEINEFMSDEMVSLLKRIGFSNIELRQDFRAVPRMIKCQKL
jgi:release factor glutamine methyltransferase